MLRPIHQVKLNRAKIERAGYACSNLSSVRAYFYLTHRSFFTLSFITQVEFKILTSVSWEGSEHTDTYP